MITKEKLLKYCEKKGYKLTKHADELIDIINSARGNKKAGQCPCKFLKGTRCLCREHKEEIETTGQCHCGLLLKPEIEEP